jgi:molybdate transport system regulatory protein
MEKPSIELNGRVWVTINGEKMLGWGRVELLERIKQSGSIRQAALQMKMSYKQAWDLIKQMNENFKLPVVISQRGGRGGGSAAVTEHGLNAIAQFHTLQNKFLEFLKANSADINI